VLAGRAYLRESGGWGGRGAKSYERPRERLALYNNSILSVKDHTNKLLHLRIVAHVDAYTVYSKYSIKVSSKAGNQNKADVRRLDSYAKERRHNSALTRMTF
jgi:hypothetical protein